MKRHSGRVSGTCRGLIAGALLAACAVASAQNFPTKPIRFLLPFAPGGIGDITARLVAGKMTENLGVQVAVENRPGAGMIPSAQAALAAPADGYTMLLGGNGTAISYTLFKSLPYNALTDFTQVSTLAFFGYVLLAGADSKFGSVADVLSFAKNNPGKVNLGTISVGTGQHLAAELFKSLSGADVQIVPYKSTPNLILELRSGALDLVFELIPGVISQIRSGTVKTIGVSALKPSTVLPGAPTIDSSGVKGYQAASWNGVNVRAGTPRPLVERLSREITAALAAPDVQQKMGELGAEARGATPDETRELMISEVAKWKAVIERAKIPLQ
jgi:tripartite-type tricarboxylate transporter receptor subunit TctC